MGCRVGGPGCLCLSEALLIRARSFYSQNGLISIFFCHLLDLGSSSIDLLSQPRAFTKARIPTQPLLASPTSAERQCLRAALNTIGA